MYEAKQVLDKNNETRMRLCIGIIDLSMSSLSLLLSLSSLELATNVEEWLWIVRREKSTYHTLNLFKSDVAGNTNTKY
jgi:hypothetical protein